MRVTIQQCDGQYRVPTSKRKDEATAYYTDDRQDAIDTCIVGFGIEGVKEDDLDIRFRNVEEWKIEGPCTTLNLVTGGKYVYQVEETKKLGGQTPFKRSNTIIRGTYSSKEKAIASVDCTKLTGQADGSFLDNPLFLGKRELEFKLGDATLRTTFSFFVVKHAVR